MRKPTPNPLSLATTATKPQLHILARQPLAGYCKTRLQTHCSPEQAATIAAVLLEETVIIAAHSWPGNIFLHGSPDQQHPLFLALAEKYDLSLTDQAGVDLGQIQTNALAVSLNFGIPAAVIGCDLPGLNRYLLLNAFTSLSLGENILGLSPDGGYYLLGLQQEAKELLQNIRWSSPEVSDRLLQNAAVLQLQLNTDLPPVNDVDTWQDLLAAVTVNPALAQRLQQRAPYTWQEISHCLAQ